MAGNLFSLWCPVAACLTAGRLLWYLLFIVVMVAAYFLASILLFTAYAVDGGIDVVVLCVRESVLSRFMNTRRRFVYCLCLFLGCMMLLGSGRLSVATLAASSGSDDGSTSEISAMQLGSELLWHAFHVVRLLGVLGSRALAIMCLIDFRVSLGFCIAMGFLRRRRT